MRKFIWLVILFMITFESVGMDAQILECRVQCLQLKVQYIKNSVLRLKKESATQEKTIEELRRLVRQAWGNILKEYEKDAEQIINEQCPYFMDDFYRTPTQKCINQIKQEPTVVQILLTKIEGYSQYQSYLQEKVENQVGEINFLYNRLVRLGNLVPGLVFKIQDPEVAAAYKLMGYNEIIPDSLITQNWEQTYYRRNCKKLAFIRGVNKIGSL